MISDLCDLKEKFITTPNPYTLEIVNIDYMARAKKLQVLVS